MFWCVGGGYIINFDEVEMFISVYVVWQYKCWEIDLFWLVDYVCVWVEFGVDYQDLDLFWMQVFVIVLVDDCIYVVYDRDWDGNCLVWVFEVVGWIFNLVVVWIWLFDYVGIFIVCGCVFWLKFYIDQYVRFVVVVVFFNYKQVFWFFGLKLFKLEYQGQCCLSYSIRLNCSGCGCFIIEYQCFDDCFNCGVRNVL